MKAQKKAVTLLGEHPSIFAMSGRWVWAWVPDEQLEAAARAAAVAKEDQPEVAKNPYEMKFDRSPDALPPGKHETIESKRTSHWPRREMHAAPQAMTHVGKRSHEGSNDWETPKRPKAKPMPTKDGHENDAVPPLRRLTATVWDLHAAPSNANLDSQGDSDFLEWPDSQPDSWGE